MANERKFIYNWLLSKWYRHGGLEAYVYEEQKHMKRVWIAKKV